MLLPALLACCVDAGGREASANSTVESCMLCHNGASDNNYAGPGLENPHPFPGADNLTCTQCHGGNGEGEERADSHVPPPPEIGDRENLTNNREAYFNRLTLAGIDKYENYVVDGKTYSALDYLQFINPGDLRVVTQARSCGKCHNPHVEAVSKSVLATEAGILSGATYAIGADHKLGNANFENTAADMGFRAVTDNVFDNTAFGSVRELLEFPVYSVRNDANGIHNNPAYDAENLPAHVNADNSVVSDSPLAHLMHEQFAFTCGDCHLGSAGANNRYGDFRSSGCTTCHMPYSLDGKSRSRDPNVNKLEPLDPDNIRAPERSHVRGHRIVSVRKTLTNGKQQYGIDDYACAGCHQGSNRTVMQYWGIRLDQNQNLRRKVQYPANPFSYQNTSGDTRLFDPVVNNNTFNGRNRNQYILFEDYDDDGRDDTPPDVHYEAGLGCIDCHGSYDLHGDVAGDSKINSRMEHGTAIQCQSCHGGVSSYAATKQGVGYDGQTKELAIDTKGKVLRHVVKEADGNYYLYSRLTGRKHFISQTRDTVIDSGKTNPFNDDPIFNTKASFAMGRDDGNAGTGSGPNQGGAPTGFMHADTMDCASCHASWTNTCMGCHLDGEYNTGNNFSNITGQRIVFREDNADFVYQSPVFFQLGVNSRNKITQVSPNTKMFFSWKDRNNNLSKTFTFTDRNGNGLKALGHNAMMAHSIRGKVSATNEGPRYCAACHLTQSGLDTHKDIYNTFRQNMAADRWDLLDFDVLKLHFGQNPGNRLNSPLWVHMVAGLGTGLFLFDENGCPINPLDFDNDRKGCDNVRPGDIFSVNTVLARVKYNLDRVVGPGGIPFASSNHAQITPVTGPNLRVGAPNQNLAGPLGGPIVARLADPTTGIILQVWLDADGNMQLPQGAPAAPSGSRNSK